MPPTPLRSATLTLAALLMGGGVAACGGARGSAEAELGPAREAIDARTGRRCVYADPLENLPSVQHVLPPGTAGSLRLWGYGREAADTVILSIRYGEEGALEWVRTMVGSHDLSGMAELERLVGSAVPESGQPDWGVRLVLTGDGTPVRVLPAVTCRPVARSRIPTPAPLATRAERLEMQRAASRRIEVRVRLDDRGRVIGAQISQSSGSRVLDDYALAAARDTSFEPALHDGFPVPSVTRLRFELNRR